VRNQLVAQLEFYLTFSLVHNLDHGDLDLVRRYSSQCLP
jgi:hypothetical protein